MSKEFLAYLTIAIIASFTIWLAVRRKIDWKLTTIFLIFALIFGFGIVNHDLIKKVKWGDFEIESAKREIVETKEIALKEIRSEVENQKSSIIVLMNNAAKERHEIETQKHALNDLIKTATDLQIKINKQKSDLIGLNKSAIKTKTDIKILNDASAKIALLLVKTTYLTLTTRGEYGTNRLKMAITEINNDLNKNLPIIIPNKREREDWVKKLQNILPPQRQQQDRKKE